VITVAEFEAARAVEQNPNAPMDGRRPLVSAAESSSGWWSGHGVLESAVLHDANSRQRRWNVLGSDQNLYPGGSVPTVLLPGLHNARTSPA
jgi:hypothetical protein